MKRILLLQLILPLFLISEAKASNTASSIPMVVASVSNPTLTSFTLNLDTAVADLAPSNLEIMHCAVVQSVVASSNNKSYTVTTSMLTPNTTYTLVINKVGYEFSKRIIFITNSSVGINVTISNVTTNSFRLFFDKPIVDFAASNITINNSANTTGMTTTDSQNFNVTTSALNVGTTYNIVITKTGYIFSGNLSFVPQTPIKK